MRMEALGAAGRTAIEQLSLTGGKVETWDFRNSWFLKILLLTLLKTAIGDVDTLPPYGNKN